MINEKILDIELMNRDITLIDNKVICKIPTKTIITSLNNVKQFSKYNLPTNISLMDRQSILSAKYIEDGKYDHVFIKNKYFVTYEKIYDVI